MKSYLAPTYTDQKSFYNKAVIVTLDNHDIELHSYNTHVATCFADGTAEVYNMESKTTLRHIKEFLKQNGVIGYSESVTKKFIKENYFTTKDTIALKKSA